MSDVNCLSWATSKRAKVFPRIGRSVCCLTPIANARSCSYRETKGECLRGSDPADYVRTPSGTPPATSTHSSMSISDHFSRLGKRLCCCGATQIVARCMTYHKYSGVHSGEPVSVALSGVVQYVSTKQQPTSYIRVNLLYIDSFAGRTVDPVHAPYL